MCALGSADLENSARHSLESQSDERGGGESQSDDRSERESKNDERCGGSVLPPLTQKLRVDEELKLSRKNFIQSIEYSFRNKNITHLSQLTAKPPFPTHHVMA
jgi:hypothetical protein